VPIWSPLFVIAEGRRRSAELCGVVVARTTIIWICGLRGRVFTLIRPLQCTCHSIVAPYSRPLTQMLLRATSLQLDCVKCRRSNVDLLTYRYFLCVIIVTGSCIQRALQRSVLLAADRLRSYVVNAVLLLLLLSYIYDVIVCVRGAAVGRVNVFAIWSLTRRKFLSSKYVRWRAGNDTCG